MSDETPPPAPLAVRRRFGFGRLIDDFLVLSSGQLASKILGFVAFAWLARTLPVADYGVVETAVGMVAIGVTALELGTGAVGVRRVAQGEADARTVLGSVISARMLMALTVAPGLAIAYMALADSERANPVIALFALSLLAVPFNHNWFFQSKERMGLAAAGQTIKMGVFLAAVFAFAPHRHGMAWVGAAEITAAAAVGLFYSALAFNALKPARPIYGWRAGFALLKESAPLGASSFVNSVGQYFPVLIVAAIGGAVQAADFGAAQRLYASLITFSFVYYFNLYPLIARHASNDASALKEVVDASVRVTAWVGVAVATLLWILSGPIMRIVFGPGFTGAGPEFGVLAWSGAVTIASGNARWLLVTGKRNASLLAAQIAGAAVAIALTAALTPRLGAIGGSFAAVGGSLAIWAVSHWGTKGLDVRPRLSGVLPAALSGLAVVGAVSAWMPEPLLGAAAASAGLSIAMLFDRWLAPALKTLAAARAAA